MSSSEETPRIIPPQGEDQAQALDCVLGHLEAGVRRSYVQQIVESAAQDPASLGVLLAAYRGATLAGAVWAQTLPGAIAMLWPPRLVGHAPADWPDRLLAAVIQRLRPQPLFVECLLELDADDDARRLQTAGFEQVATLVYLVSSARDFPRQRPATEFELLPYQQDLAARLAQQIERTYAGTLDCPRLNGLRTADEVLAGYRATGVFRPENWFLVRWRDADVGCLVLADHPASHQLELVYFGLVPEVRGRGWGFDLVRFAQWWAWEAGRQQVVLAADAQNEPALDIYSRAGFIAWDRRVAYILDLTAPQ